MAIGLWLQISAFSWAHEGTSRVCAWLLGVLIAFVAVLSLSAPPLRWLNSVLAVWLLAWTAASAATEALTYWNGMVCGVLVLVLSTISTRSLPAGWKD